MCKMRAAEGKKEKTCFFLYHPTLWCTYKKEKKRTEGAVKKKNKKICSRTAGGILS
jgi:hypothetical protein